MKKHAFLNLKIGTVEQYAMVIKKAQLDYWKNLGWLTFTEVGLPEGDEEADMLYGEIRKNEILVFNRPLFLRDISFDRLVGVRIKGISTHLGTYGMGGPGFFGLLLDNSDFLTYTVWGAGTYVIVDNRVVECNTNLYNKTKPWVSNYGDNLTWDDLTAHITGSTINSIVLRSDSCELTLKKAVNTITLRFVKNDSRLPRSVGRKRNAYKKGVIADYLVFQNKNGTLIV